MNLKPRLFWLISSTAHFLYRRCPLFGTLKAALGVVERDGQLLMIERNDGRGLCFPGGISLPWEAPERSMRREVLEETGLRVTKSVLRFDYLSAVDIPVRVTVFTIEVDGVLRDSWEGTPRWLPLEDIFQRLIPGQRPVAEMLARDRGGAL